MFVTLGSDLVHPSIHHLVHVYVMHDVDAAFWGALRRHRLTTNFRCHHIRNQRNNSHSRSGSLFNLSFSRYTRVVNDLYPWFSRCHHAISHLRRKKRSWHVIATDLQFSLFVSANFRPGILGFGNVSKRVGSNPANVKIDIYIHAKTTLAGSYPPGPRNFTGIVTEWLRCCLQESPFCCFFGRTACSTDHFCNSESKKSPSFQSSRYNHHTSRSAAIYVLYINIHWILYTYGVRVGLNRRGMRVHICLGIVKRCINLIFEQYRPALWYNKTQCYMEDSFNDPYPNQIEYDTISPHRCIIQCQIIIIWWIKDVPLQFSVVIERMLSDKRVLAQPDMCILSRILWVPCWPSTTTRLWHNGGVLVNLSDGPVLLWAHAQKCVLPLCGGTSKIDTCTHRGEEVCR